MVDSWVHRLWSLTWSSCLGQGLAWSQREATSLEGSGLTGQRVCASFHLLGMLPSPHQAPTWCPSATQSSLSSHQTRGQDRQGLWCPPCNLVPRGPEWWVLAAWSGSPEPGDALKWHQVGRELAWVLVPQTFPRCRDIFTWAMKPVWASHLPLIWFISLPVSRQQIFFILAISGANGSLISKVKAVPPSSALIASWASPRRHFIPSSTSANSMVKVYFLLDLSLSISLIFRGMVQFWFSQNQFLAWCRPYSLVPDIMGSVSEVRIFE